MAKKKIKLPLAVARDELKVFFYGFGIFLVLFAVVLAVYARNYQQKVLLNSYILEQNISGKDRDFVLNLLKKTDQEWQAKKIILKYQNKQYENTFANLGWDLNEESSTNKVFDYGHSRNGWQNVWSFFRSVFLRKNFQIDYLVNERLLGDWLDLINQEIAKPKIEANIIVKSGEAKIIEPETGTVINKNKLYKQLHQVFLLSSEGNIDLELIADSPLISADQARELLQQAIDKSSKSIRIIGPGGSAVFYPDDLGSMIELKIARSEKTSRSVYVSLNEVKVKTFLEAVSGKLNIAPVDARFSISNGKVYLLRPSVDGQVINIKESVSKVVNAFEVGDQKEIKLPVVSQPPSIAAQSAADIEKFGIKQLIGKATTDFSNSPSNRVHNIKNGVQSISGALVKAGEEFSTLDKLGKIDANSGYLPELVIKEDKTVPEFGGGLCQVSTTLFRAAMNAGLRITERQNHSYRVSYYEPPIGMDATIYSPKPDLRFVNDTENAILIYGYVSGYSLTFEIYGTSDGRSVEITNPEVYDITPPPETIYIDDPSLEPGEERRIDRAHSGAKAVFYYRVRRGGKIINDQKFYSYYVAWPAKYLRGPQPEGIGNQTDQNQASQSQGENN